MRNPPTLRFWFSISIRDTTSVSLEVDDFPSLNRGLNLAKLIYSEPERVSRSGIGHASECFGGKLAKLGGSVSEPGSGYASHNGKTCLSLVRHGQSQWNLENRFTGWCDVPLSEQGKKEARSAGACRR